MSALMDTQFSQLVVFKLEGLQYALPLHAVEKVERSVAISPLPKAPEIVLGVINVHGRAFPVVDLRTRFRLPARPVGSRDHLILARTSRHPVALFADEVCGVSTFADDRLVPARDIFPGLGYVEGVVTTENGIVFIHDLGTFLSLDEEQKLARALESHG